MWQPKGITIGGIRGQHRPQGCRRWEKTHVIQTLAVPIHAHLSSGLWHLEQRQKVRKEMEWQSNGKGGKVDELKCLTCLNRSLSPNFSEVFVSSAAQTVFSMEQRETQLYSFNSIIFRDFNSKFCIMTSTNQKIRINRLTTSSVILKLQRRLDFSVGTLS